MKIRSLFIFVTAIFALLPLVSIATPGHAAPNLLAQLSTPQPQVDEVLDLGTIRPDAKLEPFLRFTVPQNQSFYKLSPPKPIPFTLGSTGAYLGAGSSRNVAVKIGIDRNIPGLHSQIITISGNDGQPFKKVLVKVNILPHNTIPKSG
ncbi:hypothetical protein [Chamaesiphon polymorphus]|uniref:AMIN domain-containing protein n=1 Tax=Chamaesiphon polymorphus CCALA 037 TaxID=2107692 RepID=A0A2T1GC33_9CYAN|nr:hypothetical protein [Chamaesiphon polymorphus]PSB54926.1 hypothetical protein C7B77_16680 [Chamaesiphon polymorphus CCALA 037]